ncbi:unnamed protein product [Adineta ricciae]|uniref:Dynactin subunit 1 n=1 Tax=Adineta ricciae TaxID=249248 RepID=A0A813QZQ7_ADIRI|nr:unnamed protein product [Adineta ricciae]
MASASTIAFIGKTEFADGEWIGVILDEPKGKNNGSVRKKGMFTNLFHREFPQLILDGSLVKYFTCLDNHGLYVRPTQIEFIIDESNTHLPQSTSNHSVKSQSNGSENGQTKSSILSSKQLNHRTSTRVSGSTRTSQSIDDKLSASKDETKQPLILEPQSKPITIVSSSESPTSDTEQLIYNLQNKIIDQKEQIQTLIDKRRDDFEKIKEFERIKLQLEQLQANKHEAQQRINELNEKFQQQETELNDVREKFAAYREEMADTEIRIESLTLDLEIAEEKLEMLTSDNAALKFKLEEVELEYDVMKGEMQLNGSNHVANGLQKKADDERTIKMEQALIKLRDLLLTEKAENESLKKECKLMEQRADMLMKEHENAKTDIVTMQATITDLKEQVDIYVGAQQMADILTTKNLSLEEQVRELQEEVDNLESICDMDKEIEESAKEVEQELRQTIDLLQNQLHEKERQVEQLHYTISDHERTILKFRESLKNMQTQNEQTKRQLEKYDEQLKLVGSLQSSEFKAKVIETKTYGEFIENELRKVQVVNLTQHIQYLTLFLPIQMTKRGGDHDCILVHLLIQRLVAKCEVLMNETLKKVQRIDQVIADDVLRSHRAEQWSFTCKILQSLAIFAMILTKYNNVLEICNSTMLRQLANSYHDLLSHEKAIDFLLELLQKDQLYDSITLNTLDKTIRFYEHIYNSHLDEEKFSMVNYLQGVMRVVSFSSDALQADIQRIQILQKEFEENNNEQGPFTMLIKRLMESNEQLRAQAGKINRLVSDEDDSNRSLILDTDTISSIESTIRHLVRLTKTFYEICSGLTNQILILSDPNERISTQDIESIAYQACDKIFKQEDDGPYDSLWNSMYESVSTIMKLRSSLEDGLFDSKMIDTNEKPKQAIYILAEQFKLLMNELETVRNRFELKEEELVDVKKLLKLKQDEISEYCIRLALNDKKLDTLSKQFDDDTSKYLQILETTRMNAQKEIKQCEDAMAVLQNDNEKLEQEINELKDGLKQQSEFMKKSSIVSKIDGQHISSRQVLVPHISQDLIRLETTEQEIITLRNTVRLLKDELWQLKMSHTSNELTKLATPMRDTKSTEINDIYRSSTLLLNDLFSTIANYKITGENVAVKQELIRSKMKLVDQTAVSLNHRLHQCQSQILPGSTIQTGMQTFLNPQFSKFLAKDRQLAAEIHLPGEHAGGDVDLTQEQYCRIMQSAIGCI